MHTVEAATICVLACEGKLYCIVLLRESVKEPNGTANILKSPK